MEKDVDSIEKVKIRGEIEAALFVSDKPVSVEDLCTKLNRPKNIVTALIADFLGGPWKVVSLEVVRVGDDTYTMQIRPEYTSKVKKFASHGLIPEGVMRTLTIIALKQPIPLELLCKLRGASALMHVDDLRQRGLIHLEGSGALQTVNTTDQFAVMFGLSRDVTKMISQLKAQLGVKD